MALEFTGMEPVAVAQRMSGRLLKGRSDAVLITRTMKLLYKDRPDIDVWFIVSGDRDLNALCKALKDEDKAVYLIAGDKALANELRDSPYLRDGVFLLEDLIPEARWTRTGILRTDDTQAGKEEPQRPRARGTRGGRGRTGAPTRTAAPASVPAVVPAASPESEKEQRRLVVLLLDQLVALRSDDMPRGDFVRSVTMCWLSEGHPLVRYARQPSAAVVHLFNFVSSTRARDDKIDWVNSALFSELLSRVEGDALESNLRRAVESGLMRPEEHGRKAGYVVDRDHGDARVMLGDFSRLNGESHEDEPRSAGASRDELAGENESVTHGDE